MALDNKQARLDVEGEEMVSLKSHTVGLQSSLVIKYSV